MHFCFSGKTTIINYFGNWFFLLCQSKFDLMSQRNIFSVQFHTSLHKLRIFNSTTCPFLLSQMTKTYAYKAEREREKERARLHPWLKIISSDFIRNDFREERLFCFSGTDHALLIDFWGFRYNCLAESMITLNKIKLKVLFARIVILRPIIFLFCFCSSLLSWNIRKLTIEQKHQKTQMK